MFEDAERIADAILYEGYVLYPYRASAAKNRFRWQFGVLAPRAPGDDGEPWFSQTECLVTAASQSLSVRARFLRPTPTATGWLEGSAQVIDVPPIDLQTLPIGCCMSLNAGIDAHVLIRVE